METKKLTLKSVLVIAFLLIFSGSGYSSTSPIKAEYEIKEALEAGVISLTFTGQNDGEDLEIKVEKLGSKPVKINLMKGITLFEFGDNQISIYSDDTIQIDLTAVKSDIITIKQTGNFRIISGSATARKKGQGIQYQCNNFSTRISAGN